MGGIERATTRVRGIVCETPEAMSSGVRYLQPLQNHMHDSRVKARMRAGE